MGHNTKILTCSFGFTLLNKYYFSLCPRTAVKPTIPSTPTVKKNNTTTSQCFFFLCASTAVNPTTATNPNVNKNGTTTTASAEKTSSAAQSISKPSSVANTLFTEQSNTTPFPPTKTPTTTPPFTTGSDVTTKHSIESRTSTTPTGEANVHEERNESEAKETMTYVIIGVVTSLIVIGGAVVGTVLCFCRKWYEETRTTTERNKIKRVYNLANRNQNVLKARRTYNKSCLDCPKLYFLNFSLKTHLVRVSY